METRSTPSTSTASWRGKPHQLWRRIHSNLLRAGQLDATKESIYKDVPASTRDIVEPALQAMKQIYNKEAKMWQKLLDHFSGTTKGAPKGHREGRQTLWYIWEAGSSSSSRKGRPL